MSDIFREVDEDLRRDKMERLAKRYGGLGIAVAVALVAATAGYKSWESWQLDKQRDETSRLVVALSQPDQDPAKTVETLTTVAADAEPGVATIAQLNAAGLLARSGKLDESAAVLDGVSAKAGDASYRDLATLLSVMQQLDSGDAAQLQSRLQPLSTDGNPWRHSARELQGLLAVRSGDKDKARTLFQQIADDAQAPSGIRTRAAELAALYGKT